MEYFIVKLSLLLVFSHSNVFVCFGYRVEETRLVTKGDNISFHFAFIIEFTNAFVYFGKESEDILFYEISYLFGTELPRITYYSHDYEGRIFVTRLDSENTTLTLIDANISDSGTYWLTNEWNIVERWWSVFVIGIKADNRQMMINEGTTVSFLGYPLLSTISLHSSWNISCLWLFDGKRKFNESNAGHYFHVHGDRMWIPRVSRDLDKKVVTYRCCSFDDMTVEVKRILSVNYTKCNELERTTVAGASTKVLTGSDVIRGDSGSSNQTFIIVGISLVLILLISLSLAVAVRHTCKLRWRRQHPQSVAKSVGEERPHIVCSRDYNRSQSYLHALGSDPIYDLPDELRTSKLDTTHDYLQMDPMGKARDSYVSMK